MSENWQKKFGTGKSFSQWKSSRKNLESKKIFKTGKVEKNWGQGNVPNWKH